MSGKPRGMTDPDPSNGWDAAADVIIHDRGRSTIGVAVLREWARDLPAGGSVLDLGCGAGLPVSRVLVDLGCRVSAIDASPRLVAAYRQRFPGSDVACEPVETSAFFGQTFDAVVSIGMLFMLDEPGQRAVIRRVARHLVVGGRFLCTAPWQTATWIDPTTMRRCRSLGRDEYVAAFARSGLAVEAMPVDEGENHYFSTVRV